MKTKNVTSRMIVAIAAAFILTGCSDKASSPQAENRSSHEGNSKQHSPPKESAHVEQRFAIPFNKNAGVDQQGSITWKTISDGTSMIVPERPGDALLMSMGFGGSLAGGSQTMLCTGEGSEIRFAGAWGTAQGGIIAEEGSRLCLKISKGESVYMCGLGCCIIDGKTNRLGYDRTVASCIALLVCDDPVLQEGGIRDLGRLTKAADVSRVVPKLAALLQNRPPPAQPVPTPLRLAAIEALGLIGTADCFRLLKQTLANETEDITRKYCEEALFIAGGYVLLNDPMSKGVPLEEAAESYSRQTVKEAWPHEMLLVRMKQREADAAKALNDNANSSVSSVATATRKLRTNLEKAKASK
jgi:hypothetical protein